MAWTDDQKAKAIALYTEAEPTPENSVEIIKDIADQLEQTANGVRMILIQANVYVKKGEAASTATKATKTTKASEGTKRVSKEDSIAALRSALEAKGVRIDDEILGKLTGKAAVYFAEVLA